jgi:GH25 family lysozyme M1 (1,4-beta-N-acetylmuramidase)
MAERARAPITRAVIIAVAFVLLTGVAVTAAPPRPVAAATTVPPVALTGFLVGPDVSRWQHAGGNIDWQAVAASGVSFTIVKATEGPDGATPPYTDPYFAGDFAGAGSAGLYRGSYHMARPALPLTTAGDQARQYIAVTGTLHGALDLPPVLDLEHTGGLSPADLTAWAATWLSTVQQLTGRLPMIYTSPNFWATALGNTTTLNQYFLWIARWTDAPDPSPLPGGWTSWTFWQYTSTGSIPGISTAVDISRFCCSLARLAEISGSPSGRPHLYLRDSLTSGVADRSYVYAAPAGGTLVMCDWNGDGVDTPAVFLNGIWYLTNARTGGLSQQEFGYGGPGDIPVCGDWDGNGTDTPGVFRHGSWYLTNTTGNPFADVAFGFGNPTDAPLVGDWNGDRRDTPAVKRDAVWYLVDSLGRGTADRVFGYGNAGDVGVVGEWNGSGRDGVGVRRDGTWYLSNTPGQPRADIVVGYGDPGDLPVTGRWTAGARVTIGIVRPTF